MTTATNDTSTLDADRYLKEVEPHLAALPPHERADLLEDLAQHLREIAAEPGPPLWERLGSPQAYAAELLSSAGVTDAGPASPRFLARATAAVDRARASWAGEEVVRLWPVLRPAWWVVRACLAVSLLSATHLGGGALVGLLGLLVAVPVSVRLGQRQLLGAGRLAVIAGNVVLGIYALTLLGGAADGDVRYVESYGPVTATSRGCLSTASGRPITNLYAYDAEGRLLDPVLLYDQNGLPIDNLCPELDDRGRRLSTDYRQDVNGAPVINAFPRRQGVFLSPDAPFAKPGSPAQPDLTVPVKPPAVVVPRLTPTTAVTTTSTTPPAG